MSGILFENRLITRDNIEQIANEIREAFADKPVSIRIGGFHGEREVYRGLLFEHTPPPSETNLDDWVDEMGVAVSLSNPSIPTLTNNSRMTMMFDNHDSIAIETNSDPIIEWVGAESVLITCRTAMTPLSPKSVLIAVEANP